MILYSNQLQTTAALDLHKIRLRLTAKLQKHPEVPNSTKYVKYVLLGPSSLTIFVQNEKKRDADWAERINNILARRDELLREADIGTSIYLRI